VTVFVKIFGNLFQFLKGESGVVLVNFIHDGSEF
jgi:hypothetical protein